MALIQQTQVRMGLPLISAGYELTNQLTAWEKSLREVPDAYLSRAYDRAAANWDWLDKRGFKPDVMKAAYRALVVEDRQRAEAERRNAARRNPDTYGCWHCCDNGYQALFKFFDGRWYHSARPCSCEAAPAVQRNQSPLQEPDYVRGRLSQYVKRSDLIKHGPPNDTFEVFTFAIKGETYADATDPGQA